MTLGPCCTPTPWRHIDQTVISKKVQYVKCKLMVEYNIVLLYVFACTLNGVSKNRFLTQL